MASLFPRLSPRPAAAASRSLRLVALTVGLVAAAASAAAMAPVQRVVSPGGIEAWLMEAREVPLITVRLSFEGGALQDPEGKYGTAIMAAYMFNESAGPLAVDEFTRRLARMGAGIFANTGFERFTVSFSTPTAHKDEAFELLRLAFNAPRFDDEPMLRARREYLTRLDVADKNPSSVGSQALHRHLFGRHRMGDWIIGTREGLHSIGPADLEAYRRRVLTRSNVKVSVVGDIDARALGPLLDRLLQDLPAKAELRPVPAPAAASGTCQVIAANIPQAIVQFAALTPRLTWRQQLADGILQSILGDQTTTSRLFLEVRAKRGLVYGISTARTDYADFSIFSGSFGAKMGDVAEAMAVTRSELRRMVEEGPTEQEVADVKRAAVGGILLGLNTGAALADLLVSLQVDERPITILDDFAGEIEKVTRQDVWDVAKLMLDPDRLAVTIVGGPPQAGLCDQLGVHRR